MKSSVITSVVDTLCSKCASKGREKERKRALLARTMSLLHPEALVAVAAMWGAKGLELTALALQPGPELVLPCSGPVSGRR